jgi:hypothetical protein
MKINRRYNKGNAKRGVSPRLKNWPGDLDLWSMTLKIDRVPDSPKYVPSLVKIHWRMLILVFTRMLRSKRNWPGDLDLWPWKSIGFQILLRTKYMYVPSLVKTHWRMLILECSQGCYAVIFFDPVTLTVDLENQYPTNVHIFKLGSGNVQSFMNFWLIM